ncbi:MAG: CoB--CoM heterodisulfide reductase iron-sulfur subunit B family protein, partial [Candidatus Heimdallarchaeota archaeon]
MSKYALFLGCTIPYRLPFVEAAVRQTLELFNIELVDLPFGCCPDPGGAQAFSSIAWYTLAARNLSMAEEQGLDIVTACSGCFETLKVTKAKLESDPLLQEEVNEYLSGIDREFKGTVDVLQYQSVYYDEIGPERIAAEVTDPLTGFWFATHPGCHYSKPANLLQTEDPEKPHKLDALVEALGAQSVPYLGKLLCCGAGTRGVNPSVSLEIAHQKILEVEKANVDGMVTICPSCYVSYDVGQVLMA